MGSFSSKEKDTVKLTVGIQKDDEEFLKNTITKKDSKFQEDCIKVVITRDGAMREIPLIVAYPHLPGEKLKDLVGDKISNRARFWQVALSIQEDGAGEKKQVKARPKLETNVEILNFNWLQDLEKYKRFKIVNSGECEKICNAIYNAVPPTVTVVQPAQFEVVCKSGEVTTGTVDDPSDDADMNVVVTLKRLRVETDAENAIEKANITKDMRDKTILLMFHKIMGSKTVDDVSNVMYRSDDVLKTFHVPFQAKE